MRLVPLWEADEERAYDLQMSFLPEENGFVNTACGLDREGFGAYVQLRKRNSQGLDLPEGYVPDTVYVLENDDGDYVGLVNLRHRLAAGCGPHRLWDPQGVPGPGIRHGGFGTGLEGGLEGRSRRGDLPLCSQG